jgi:hypothetical protein
MQKFRMSLSGLVSGEKNRITIKIQNNNLQVKHHVFFKTYFNVTLTETPAIRFKFIPEVVQNQYFLKFLY